MQFLTIIGHLARKEEKMLANHMFWQLMVSYTHLLLLLKTPVMWLSIIAFNNAGKPKWILRKFDVSRIQARLDGLPHLETLHGKIWTLLRGLPGLVDRFTRLDRSPHLSCQHDQINWEIIWTGRLPYLIGLPHIPGVAHHVNMQHPSLLAWVQHDLLKIFNI